MNKVLIVFFIVSLMAAMSCKHEIPKPPGPEGICFENDILPVFQSYCAKSGCHDATTASDGYVLDSYANIISKEVEPGNAAGSKIYRVLTEDGDDRMPWYIVTPQFELLRGLEGWQPTSIQNGGDDAVRT